MEAKLKNNRIGERRIMKCGEECEIIEYNGALDIVVKFLRTGELVKCQYNDFKRGAVKSHFTPSVYGVGVIGLEKMVDEEGKQLKSYDTWRDMLKRCYSEKLQRKRPTYIGCSVCDEWKYYKKFKEWYDENYYEIEGQKMTLDKDILVKGNKIYSPETCVFVPNNINLLFTKNNANRGNLPIGVSLNGKSGKYQADGRVLDIKTDKTKNKHLGLHNTPKEAFNSYKEFKENYIKQVADHYKNQIPSKLYKAMYKYEVHIDD